MRKLKCLLIALVLIYAAACGYFYVVQHEKIFEPVAEIYTTPERMGMACERVEIPVGSGGTPASLAGLWIPAKSADPARAPAFLYLHGQDATIGKNLEHAQRLREIGCNVLLIDYRGYGESYGKFKPSEESVYDDAVAGWDYLTGELGVGAERAFIIGHSLGGAIAIELATRRPEAAGLVTKATFTSILGMSKHRYGGLTGLLPMKMLLRYRFDSLAKIGKVKIPTLFVHGKADAKVPFHMSEELYDESRNSRSGTRAQNDVELLLIEGGEHRNTGSIGWVEYQERMSAFVAKHVAPAGGLR